MRSRDLQAQKTRTGIGVHIVVVVFMVVETRGVFAGDLHLVVVRGGW